MRGLAAPFDGCLRGGWRAVAGVLAVVGLVSGCGQATGVVDAGQAHAPLLPETVWTVAADAPTAEVPPEEPLSPEVLEGLTVPAGAGADRLDPREVIAHDPLVHDLLKQAVLQCAPGSGRGLRPPVLRDLTRDGRPELLLLVDPDPRIRPTDSATQIGPELHIYWVDGGRVYSILFAMLDKGTQVDLLGHDLVLRSPTAQPAGSRPQVTTERYRWDEAWRALEVSSRVVAPAPSIPAPKSPKAARDTR
ncbi:hypothetical protein [Streptomyces sp. HUAS TT7]|uniref:hypothetical protein n=1 Tax=Streptomyces sp. HUAS TT7 TaxID=3447507 RepID=UPI003F65FDB9